MTFQDSLKNTKLDFSKIIIIPSGGGTSLKYDFEINPRDFLKYAKEDIASKEIRGIINSISNSKRAIDCQIDNVLYNLGIDYHKIPKSVENFVKCFEIANDTSFKSKLISALNLAPNFLISKTRVVRHRLEHHYKTPSIDEANDSIDIADLFIRSIEGLLKLPTSDFYITDEKHYQKDYNAFHENFDSGYLFSFDLGEDKIKLREIYPGSRDTIIYVPNTEPEFFGFIRLMNSIDDDFELTNSFKAIAQLINHPTPSKHIDVIQY